MERGAGAALRGVRLPGYTSGMSDSSREHQAKAAAQSRARGGVRCAVLTISDTRTMESDGGGAMIVQVLGEFGHQAVGRVIVKDDAEAIRGQLEAWIGDPNVQAILTTGGTGISRRDVTIEVVRSLLTAELEGFGELFRMLSYEQVQAAAMMSRAVGGLVIGKDEQAEDTFVFAMPGSVNAVETAMRGLIGPQLAHLVWERRKTKGSFV